MFTRSPPFSKPRGTNAQNKVTRVYTLAMTSIPPDVLAELNAQQERFVAHIATLKRGTTLAMRAARHGLDSLTVDEWRDLYCFVGFDRAVFETLAANA